MIIFLSFIFIGILIRSYILDIIRRFFDILYQFIVCYFINIVFMLIFWENNIEDTAQNYNYIIQVKLIDFKYFLPNLIREIFSSECHSIIEKYHLKIKEVNTFNIYLHKKKKKNALISLADNIYTKSNKIIINFII